jgi:4-cresol dehydrogenase (hydroxylating) flavoprotein subunit
VATVLPAGISEDAVTRAIDAFVDALGPDAVLTDPVALREFRDPYAYKASDEWDASAAVMPTTTEQVQAVVRIANEHGIPLWTIGQGRNNTYGGAAPRVRGSVIVNLREMNRVLEVNEELCYAVVEPGVRWFDLHDALEAAGGRCWPSIPDLGWGSVVGNTLEYGRGYTPYGDHATNVCGMEVVLPDGEVLRTGMGGQSGN